MLTKQALDDLLARSILEAQKALAEFCLQQRLPIGAALYCRVVWPKQHKSEQFLLIGLSPHTDALHVVSLSDAAVSRTSTDNFHAWWALQDVHEQYAFTLRSQVLMHKNAQPSGIVLVQ